MTAPIPDNLCMDKNYICISSSLLSVSKDDMKMKFVHTTIYIRLCFGLRGF